MHASAPVQVVDGVAPVVLNVPAEAGEAHAHVRPRHLHPGDVCVHVAQHRPLDVREVVQVPARHRILLLLRRGRFFLLGKATPHLTGQQICPVLHHNLQWKYKYIQSNQCAIKRLPRVRKC